MARTDSARKKGSAPGARKAAANKSSGGAKKTGRADGDADTAAGGRPSQALTRQQKLELYYWMRLTRTLEERLVALYRQTKVVGGLFRSLGQEADAVGSCYALEQRDVLSPLIRNL